ncbi:MAG: ornithine carbamoyltransferase [Methanophagales archaeon]|nr:ornithine carbamoyltransferase [Methanophagales archaeon]
MNLISIFDLSGAEIEALVEKAEELKAERKKGVEGGVEGVSGRARKDLEGRTLALIFEKPSTRTRVSFEVAGLELGGNVLSLNWNELQLGRGERVQETAKVLSAYVDAVVLRAFRHSTVQEFARHASASVPVVNGLTDLEHPCQTLADLMTIKERKGRLAGVKVAWVGDGNNVCNSLIGGAALTGMEIRVACPRGYEPDEGVVEKAKACGCEVLVTDDAEEAVAGADVLYTDVWVSMGDEEASEQRKRDLQDFQINADLVRAAKEDAIVLHCMPVHLGEEITEAVLNSDRAVIFEQAENRLHAQKALLHKLLLHKLFRKKQKSF